MGVVRHPAQVVRPVPPAQGVAPAPCTRLSTGLGREAVVPGRLPGLANLGNTCFANSTLQCILNTPGWFLEACLAFRHLKESSPSKAAALGRSFQTLSREYGANAATPLPASNAALTGFKSALEALDARFAGGKQQDAYEFLGCLLEALEDGFGALFPSPSPAAAEGAAAAGAKPSSKMNLVRGMCGVTTHTRRHCHSCSSCFEVDSVTDTALRLPLLSPVAQFDEILRAQEESTPITLEALLGASRLPEVVADYDCDACRERSVQNGVSHVRSTMSQQACVISATNDLLIIVLYRFGQTLEVFGTFQPIKVTRKVACPKELELDTGSYSLFGVVSHMGGSLANGHYVAAVRSRRDGSWYECNDDRVEPLSLPDATVTSVKAGADPYILFYHRQPGVTRRTPLQSQVAPMKVGPMFEAAAPALAVTSVALASTTETQPELEPPSRTLVSHVSKECVKDGEDGWCVVSPRKVMEVVEVF